MNCKDCIYYEVCDVRGLTYSKHQPVESVCEYFKDKSKYIELPYKVGDTVYMPWLWNDTEGVACLEVTRIIIDGNKPYVETDFATDDEDYSEAYNGGKFYFDDFGETVFLTKPQAKQKLKEMKDNEQV